MDSKRVDNTTVGRVFAQLSDQQMFFSTRAMRSEFLERHNRIAKAPKKNMYHTLLNDGSSSSCSAEASVDEYAVKAVLKFDDPETVLDLRKTNGKAGSTICVGVTRPKL